MNPNTDKLPLPDMHEAVDPNKSSADFGGVPTEKLMPSESMPPMGPQPQLAGAAQREAAMIALPTQHPTGLQTQTKVAPAAGTDDDSDMSIERECVAKAKAIVERTSSDPFTQTKEIGKVKAELLKKRYGKELKTSER
jgi:hypothetical protein